MRARRIAGGVAIAAFLIGAPLLMAADHQDGPVATADPSADITDIFAWMSADDSHINLVMDLFPNAMASSQFSDAVQYVFHIGSRSSFSAAASTEHTTNLICTFDATQKISCWLGTSEFVTGDASGTSGITSADGKLHVFAGLRADPFFFNLSGFKATAADVATAADAGMLPTPNDAGCFAVSPQTSAALVAQLSHDADGGPPTDSFAGFNVISIVVSLDKTLVTQGGSIVSVWGATLK